MDLKELRKRMSPKHQDLNSNIISSRNQTISTSFLSLSFFATNLTKTFSALLIILPVFVIFAVIHRHPTQSDRISSFADARVLDYKTLSNFENHDRVEVPDAKLLGGLLSSGFDEASCLSRYESYMYRKATSFKPSGYLLSKLRKYEELHRQCGPGTQQYNEALKQLKFGNTTASPTECNYVVWMAFSGLGNRILTISAAFLYALLSNRVLLVDPGTDMKDLFCEPFPSTSWFLPGDFPLTNQFKDFNQESPKCHGYMLKNKHLNASAESIPPYLYLHLGHDYNDNDKLFFCDDDQSILSKVPWLIMKTDNYFVPSLFLIPSFEQELFKLFPEKVTIFHHLGRYLFHPTNQVWGLITRYYNAYLAEADERISIQIRTFEDGPGPFQHVKDQIKSCLSKEKLLPEISKDESLVTSSKNKKTIAVLTTSLSAGYYETLRELYWEYPTVNGDMVGFYQPSHEGHQQSQKKMHSRKAWAEMYLLSLSDKLVTSAWSTFGYVAQGLGGLKPWILNKPEDEKTPDPPCVRAMSIEPCFHAPPFWDCKKKTGIDTGNLVPHVRHCEDMTWGLKVVDGREEL
ncbi:galactoside 2-alpha-L-fucosyltransferase-like [Silene latifolia]|uniref:galactoside 2-alpha-L-fucosyltransferase-like n=1 Tax=Silene latifolia TaxID=37657 RepID=UPI003D7703DA